MASTGFRPAAIDDIVDAACRFHHVDRKRLNDGSVRTRLVSSVRSQIAWILRQNTLAGSTEIADALGLEPNSSTFLFRRHVRLMESDRIYRLNYLSLLVNLQATGLIPPDYETNSASRSPGKRE